ncbi:cell surface hyaluronidase-like [Gigantopelta aegis]|uniref:cell surface hyaluronidase-like n=1 Tax=Gigantopelta aegis TaxID=1735272 RepID=UPI001B88C14B|nr:cell surface hyaluronidase-like [Gigantopelta aegis]
MSTDYDWRQAEEFTLLPCPECANNEIKLDHEAEYMHYGQITFGVDERAEVALLTRNILVKGTLEKECYVTDNDPKDAELCGFFNEDTFGGHFKVVRGFQSVHVEGCEFTQMGQQRFVGKLQRSYPIHFHMCDDVDGAWVKNNAIHDCKARFLTIHGTDGLQVMNNVGYKTLGHGFFLEDSVEQRNILDGNLGGGVSHGSHIMSDMKKSFCAKSISVFCDALSVFWLTHPNNKIRNNVAAGSDNAGFWYITAKKPLSHSILRQETRGTVPPMQAFYSKIDEFTNNVAHSCAGRGLRVDARISNGEESMDVFVPENGVIGATSSHFPHDPPTKDGNLVVSIMDGYVGKWL